MAKNRLSNFYLELSDSYLDRLSYLEDVFFNGAVCIKGVYIWPCGHMSKKGGGCDDCGKG